MGWVARVCRRVMLAVGGLMVLGLNLVAAPALDELGIVSATVEVELSCPSCARGLERRLNRLGDVGAVEIRAVDDQVVLTSVPAGSLDLEAIRDVIRNAGFLPTGVRLTAVGRVTEVNDAPALALSGDVVIMLATGERSRALVAEAGGRVARVTGEASASEGGSDVLRVDAFEIP